MKKFYFTLLLNIFVAASITAQSLSNGFYRVQNLGTQRFLYVTDNTGSYDTSRDQGDFAALQLWLGEERAVSDPASIIFIDSKGGNSYDLCSQNTGIYKLVQRYVDIKSVNGGPFGVSYTVSASQSGVTKYLSDNRNGNDDLDFSEGVMGTGASSPYRNWLVYPVDAASDNYFGITPNVQIGDKYYYPFYADFSFSCYSKGMKVYTISIVSDGMAVLKELTGVIPASTPVIIECSSAKPEDNRLELLEKKTAAASIDNKLRGVYFCNRKRPKSSDAITPFAVETMRVLGKTKDGKLGFVSESENLYTYKKNVYLPANQSYLPVSENAAEELMFVTYEEYLIYKEAVGIETVADESDNVVKTYDLSGRQLKGEPTRRGIYIRNGKKLVNK